MIHNNQKQKTNQDIQEDSNQDNTLIAELNALKERISVLENSDLKLTQSQLYLKQSEERYRILVEASPIPILVHSEGLIVFANAEALQALGGTSYGQLIGKPVLDIVAPEYRYISTERINRIYRKESHAKLIELKFVRLDGQIFDVEVMGTMCDYEGKPSSQVVFKDITSRKLADNAIRERNRLENLVSRISLKLMAFNNQDMDVAFNDALGLIGEYFHADRSLLFLFSENLQDRFVIYEWCAPQIQPCKDHFLRLSPTNFSYWIEKFKKNEYVHMQNLDALPPDARIIKEILHTLNIDSIITVPLMGNEKLMGFMGFDPIRDREISSETDVGLLQTISYIFGSAIERKRANESLLIQKSYLEELFESSPDAIAILDNDDRILRINREFHRLFGYTEEEVMGKEINTLIVPEAFHSEASFLTTRIALQENIDVESIRKNKDGKRLDVSIRGKPVFLGDNQLALYAIYRDISKRKKTEEEKQKLQDQLRQAQKMEAIGSLAGGIAHDFNNVLAVIIGYTELTFDKLPENSREKSNLRHVLSAADKAREMVKQILAFSRKDEETRTTLNLGKLVIESLQLLKATFPSSIEVRSHIEKKKHPIWANSTQVHQVIMNICTNAVHVMKNTGGIMEVKLKEVELEQTHLGKSTLKPGKYHCLEFIDTGTGIKPEIIERIFEPYFTTKAQGEGTGMGLAVVHGIVKSHGGDIMVESEPGKGTTFYVYFPVTNDNLNDDHKAVQPIKEGNGHILFVDDDPSLLEMVKLMLETLGYSVVTQNNGDDALALFRSDPTHFDIVITDQAMPKMTGDQLASEIKRIRPDCAIILCTGFSERVSYENYQSLGFDALMMKPIVRKELAKLVHDFLNKNN